MSKPQEREIYDLMLRLRSLGGSLADYEKLLPKVEFRRWTSAQVIVAIKEAIAARSPS